MPIITAFNQIRLSGVLVTNSGNRLQVGSDNTLMVRDSGSFANLQYVSGVSGALATLIQGSVGGVSSVNGQSGVLTIQGAGNISVTTGLNTIIISGNTGAYANFATVTNLALTGSNLFTSLTGLSGAFNTQIASTGQQAWTAANNNAINLSGNLTQTGITLNNKINSVSGYVEETFVRNISATGYVTGILTGIDSQYINHPFAFSRIPQVQITLDAGIHDIYYFAGVSQRSTTGFRANFSDTILETGMTLQVFASI
jgi:hypothetical protein